MMKKKYMKQVGHARCTNVLLCGFSGRTGSKDGGNVKVIAEEP